MGLPPPDDERRFYPARFSPGGAAELGAKGALVTDI